MDVKIFNLVKQLHLPQRDYAIFGSGPLLVNGVIGTCNDLDILCRGKAWELVCSMGKKEFLPEYNVTIVNMYDGVLTFGTCWGIGDFDVNELIDTADVINELRFVRLEHVISYKKTRSNEKDLRHLDAIAAYLLANGDDLSSIA